ncbi:hypothetical protein [uncultured Clostridium sp.]|uniref:hypothetical protein n=1 Tax=uncultured Clostridium sp. TaxID=59620 RepID=UPI003217F7B7
MENIKLTVDRNCFGFDYYSNAMQCVVDDTKELKALLSYKSKSMVEANKTRALCDIKLAIENLQELKKAIEDEE